MITTQKGNMSWIPIGHRQEKRNISFLKDEKKRTTAITHSLHHSRMQILIKAFFRSTQNNFIETEIVENNRQDALKT